MAFNEQCRAFDSWLDQYMRLGTDDKSGRVAVVMGLLERLRDNPSLLSVADHVQGAGNQLRDHNRYVKRALERFSITSPLKEYGRKSSNLHGWIGPLLEWLKTYDFASFAPGDQLTFLNALESVAALRLEAISQGKPLIARYNKGTAKAIIADILDQAQEKKRAKDVAEYLVGAKLQLRLGEDAARPKNVNTPNWDQPADFPVGSAAIEVTVNPADSRHLSQIERILKDTTLEVWLLVRLKDREKWQNVVDATFGEPLAGRVAIADIETFVGQNISEMGGFDVAKVAGALAELFQVYNERWLPEAGTSGLRIISGDPDQE
jgi:hypothetical protein